MSLPDATETVREDGMNLVGEASMMPVVLGKASSGDLETLVLVGSHTDLHATFGDGPGVLLADEVLSQAGGPIGFVRMATSVAQSIGSVVGTFTEDGTVDSFVHSPDTGAGPDLADSDVDATAANADYTFDVKISTAGVLGTMQFQVKRNGGSYGTAVTSAVDGVYTDTVSGIVITFPAGTYVLNDAYQFTVTAGGGSVSIAATSGAGSITMDMRVRIEILEDGGRGEATFRYNLDGYDGDTESERTYTETLTIPSSGVYVLPRAGLTVTFADEDFMAGDLYVCDVLCAAPNATNVADAMAALGEDETAWRFCAVATSDQVGNATAHGLLEVALQAQLDDLAAESVYRAGMISTGGSTAAEAKTAQLAITANRVLRAYGKNRVATVKPFPGMAFPIVPAMNQMFARAAKSLLSTDLKRVADGPHQQVVKMFYDERKTPNGLNDAKVSSFRTFRGRKGKAYICEALIGSAPGSDIVEWPMRLVLDVGCETVHEVLIGEIGKGVRIATVTVNDVEYVGTIDQRDAKGIENACSRALIARLLTPTNAEGVPGHVSGMRFKIDPLHNFAESKIVKGKLSMVPLLGIRGSDIEVGFEIQLPA